MDDQFEEDMFQPNNKKGFKSKASLLGAAAFIVVVTILIVIGSFVFLRGSDEGAAVPTIEGDGAIKESPKDAGGDSIPNQDVTIFQGQEKPLNSPDASVDAPVISPESKESVGSLPLQQPAQQLEDDSSASVLNRDDAQSDKMSADVNSSQQSDPHQPSDSSPSSYDAPSVTKDVVEKKFKASSDERSSVSNDGQESRSAKEAKQPKSKKSEYSKNNTDNMANDSSGNGFRIQVASIPDEKAAEAEKQRILSKYRDIIGDLRMFVVRADLGDKGIYYRVQSGKMSKDRARSICDAMRSDGAACIIVAK